MKKLSCVIILLAACAFIGMAEAPTEIGAGAPTPVVQEEASDASAAFSAKDAPYAGAWQPFEDGFMLYLPRGWAAVELSQAQMEAGLFYRAVSGDGAMGVAVGYMSAGGLETLEDLALDFDSAGYSAVAQQSLNGIPAIRFERPQDDYRGVAFFHPVYPEYVLYVYASPLGSGDALAGRTGAALLASVSPIPAEALPPAPEATIPAQAE